MIRPVRFESNPQTAESNKFQGGVEASSEAQQLAAAKEFDAFVDQLRANGIDVTVVEDTDEPHTPDSIFPNNWISFHADGRVVLYPMQAENRRSERRVDVLDEIDVRVSEILDLTHHESHGRFLEGTGSMVLDRANRIAYACLSSRTHLDPLAEFAQRLGYEVVAFDAVDREGHAEELAVICAEAIPDAEQRAAVLWRLEETGHEVLLLSFDQLDAFAGNMLELCNEQGRRIVVMSKSASESLSDAQHDRLQQNGATIVADIGTIERAAGGSVRCMLAEIHRSAEPAHTG
jgi:hypothetical protein